MSSDGGPRDEQQRESFAVRRRRLLVAQVFASFALPAGATGAGIIAAEVGGPTWTAAPLAALVAGSGAASVGITVLTTRRGRRMALRSAYAASTIGSVVIVVSAGTSHMAPLLLGCAMFGSANAAAMLSRYASADLVEARDRGRAMSTMMLALTVGAVVAPNLLGPASVLARLAGAPPVTGIFIVAAAALLAALVCLPPVPGAPKADPLGHQLVRGRDGHRARTMWGCAAGPAAVLASANLVMVTVMAVVPPALHAHGASLHHLGLIVSAHVLAMFAPSVLVGRIADRVGARRVALVGTWFTASLAAGGAAAAASSPSTQAFFMVLLGSAWCVQVVAGSAWLLEETAQANRSFVEGIGEAWMAVAAVVGTLLAGPLLAAGGSLVLHAGLAALAALAACGATKHGSSRG